MAELPSLFDRADGTDERDGIATPPGVLLIQDNGVVGDWTDDPKIAIKLREASNSPEVERAEQSTITHTFIMGWEEGITRLETMGRGTLLVSEDGLVSRVLSSKLQRERGGFCTLVVTAEGISFDSPPDEFSLKAVDLGVHIIKHPRYYSALNPASTDDSNTVEVGEIEVSLSDIKQGIIRSIQAYMDAPFYPGGGNVNGMFQANIMSMLADQSVLVDVKMDTWANVAADAAANGAKITNGLIWDGTTANLPDGYYTYCTVPVPTDTPGIQLAIAAAKEIIGKIWRQEEQPYIIGYEMSWSSYWFRPPAISPGGVVSDPITGVDGSIQVPDYFISTEYPPNQLLTIFDGLPIENQQCYSISGSHGGGRGVYGVDYDISWLRNADDIDYQRTWFRLTRSWKGAPIGMWDTDLYSRDHRPAVPSDYDTRFLSLGG